tara:strand:- start:223 stop:489 length:267 start_codon:yes stop_codon:yes gene_type:complete
MVKEVDLVVVETKVALVELEIENHQIHPLPYLIKVILEVHLILQELMLVVVEVVLMLLVGLQQEVIHLTLMLVMVVLGNHYLLSQPQF